MAGSTTRMETISAYAIVIAAVMPNCSNDFSGDRVSTANPSAVVSAEPSRAEPVVASVRDRRRLRGAPLGELFPVAMDHVDRVVHADPDREHRGDRGDESCMECPAATWCPAPR